MTDSTKEFVVTSGENARIASAVRDLVSTNYQKLNITVDTDEKTIWCQMQPKGRPNISMDMLYDFAKMKSGILSVPLTYSYTGSSVLEFFVLNSEVRGVFNYGGGLEFFCNCVRSGRREHLRAYAYACIDALYAAHTGYDKDIIAIALVQGEALGGGFEAALACETIIAEEHSRFGLPESRFNLFPGMGAYSFLSRKVGENKAKQIILSGKIFSAKEMADLGVVDLVVNTGEGDKATKRYISNSQSKRRAYAAFSRARRCVNPVTIEELRNVTNIWVDVAFALSQQDMRKMTKFALSQNNAA